MTDQEPKALTAAELTELVELRAKVDNTLEAYCAAPRGSDARRRLEMEHDNANLLYHAQMHLRVSALIAAAQERDRLRSEARTVREALAAHHIYLPCFDRLDALLGWETELPIASSEGGNHAE